LRVFPRKPAGKSVIKKPGNNAITSAKNMNTPNPLVPQGSLLEQQKSKGKSNLLFAVLTIAAIHVVLFGGLLIQGCKPETKLRDTAANELTNASAQPDPNTFITNTPPIPDINPPTMPATYAATNLPITTPPVVTPLVPATPLESVAGTKEYKVAKGDSFYKIGKDHGVSMAAVAKANPGVEATKLKAGQVIQIPASGATPAAPASAAGGMESASLATESAAATVYVVKPNDNLTKVGKSHGTTAKAIRALNHLKTDRLSVGQKLKLPAPKAAATTMAAPAGDIAPGFPASTNPTGAPAAGGRM
jgi:LysM repeat protein